MEGFYGKNFGKIEKKNFEIFPGFLFHRRRPSLKATEGSQKASMIKKGSHEIEF